jgi:ubiquinone biosynthesis protein COQ9
VTYVLFCWQSQAFVGTTTVMPVHAKQILEKALPHVPFDGWSMQTLQLGAKEAGLDERYAEIFFKDGVNEAIRLFLTIIDENMQTLYQDRHKNCKSIRDKIKLAMLVRLEAMESYKEVVRKTTHYLSNPLNLPFSISVSYHTVDTIWRLIGDTSTDFNFYTKRLTLAGVYTSTLLFWLQDDSDHYKETNAFIDRRLVNVMQIGKVRQKIESSIKECANILSRYTR